jgi:hypothetical protein
MINGKTEITLGDERLSPAKGYIDGYVMENDGTIIAIVVIGSYVTSIPLNQLTVINKTNYEK